MVGFVVEYKQPCRSIHTEQTLIWFIEHWKKYKNKAKYACYIILCK